MPLFVISFEYLAKPLMNFGILSIFAEICLYRLNLPFSYNHYLHKCPFLSSHLNFAKPLIDFSRNLLISPKMAFSLKPTINDILLLSSGFNFCQTFDKLLPNWPFLPKLLFSLIINRQFSQTFDESSPNWRILQHLSFS